MDLEKFLSDMSLNSNFRVMDFGNANDQKKMLEIAQKKNIVLPAYDLAIFECVYAFTDRQNKNGCTLPKTEVEKALATLNGKSIDLDHLRKQVVGHWVDAKLDGDKIIAYGCIFKGSFPEDYDIVKELFGKGNLSVSFEAWGNRVANGGADAGYDLTDIEFAGGALLVKTEPAFEGADVLEMANKTKVLEMASRMIAPKHYVRGTKADMETLETARLYTSDMDSIMRHLQQCSCPSCDEPGCMDPMMIDYANNQAKLSCANCGAEMAANLTPATTLTKKGRKIKALSDYALAPSKANLNEFLNDVEISDERLEVSLEDSLKPFPKLTLASRFELADDDFAVLKTIEVEKGKSRKLRILPIHDLAHINLAQFVLEQATAQELLEKLSISKDTVDRKITRKVITIAMKELMKKLNVATVQEVFQTIAKASLKRDLTKEELEKAYSIVALKAGKSAGIATSLLKPAGQSSDANETSLLDVTMSDVEVTEAVNMATKVEAATIEVEIVKVDAIQKQLTEATAKLAEATARLAEIEAAKVAAETAAVETAKVELIKARRTELADLATAMTDADILDETKYALAKKDKEIADLKTASVKTPAVKIKTIDMVKGSSEKEVGAAEAKARDSITEMAFRSRDPKSKDKK